MLWFAVVWILVLIASTIGGAKIDFSERKPAWYVVASLLSGILCALFVALQFGIVNFLGSGSILIVLAVIAGAWVIYEGVNDVREELRDDGSRSELTIAVLLVSVIYLPAVGLGLVQGYGQLNVF